MVQRGAARFRPSAENILPASNFFQRRGIGWRFHAHGEIGAEEQESRAPELRRGKSFAEKKRGESQGSGGANKLEGLRKRDAHFANRHVIQNVGEANASHSGYDQDQIY